MDDDRCPVTGRPLPPVHCAGPTAPVPLGRPEDEAAGVLGHARLVVVAFRLKDRLGLLDELGSLVEAMDRLDAAEAAANDDPGPPAGGTPVRGGDDPPPAAAA